jgi:transposase
LKSFSSRQELVHDVVLRSARGSSSRAIARALGISRNTVKVILLSHGREREQGVAALTPRSARAPRATKVEPFTANISALLERYPDITAQRIFETIREAGFSGGYTAVKKYLRKVRPPPKPAPSLPAPEWGPGEMAESDWSPYEIEFSLTGRRKIVLFGYALVFSTRKFFDAFESEGLHPLMDGHVRAFARFGGCARRCTYDGQKAVVLRWEGHQPIYNPRFLAFAAHYEFRPRAVRGQPNAKPRVERNFWEHERSFLNGRSFRDFADFRAQLAHWLDTIVDQRRRRGKTPLDRFESERSALLPLPPKDYDTARVVYRLCGIDGFVDWQGNRYAVPYDYVTDFLPLRITERELFVYAPDLSTVARHELAPRCVGLKLDPLDLHGARARARAAASDLDQVRLAFERMGLHSLEFFRLLSAAPARHWSNVARRILLLRERYATDDVDRALGHAARFGAVAADAVERILEARHQPRTLDEYVADETARRIDTLLGTARTEPRDLDEYERLPISTRSFSPQEQQSCPATLACDLPPPPLDPPPSPLTPSAPDSTPTPCVDSDSSNTSGSSD